MTAILVCPLSRVSGLVVSRQPERIISLLDPDSAFPVVGPRYADKHLRLQFHDVHATAIGHVVPSREHVEELLAFAADWNRDGPLLIHCRAGIARSTAAAFIVACLRDPDSTEHVIAMRLRRASPLARPNETLIALADEVMNRGGRMIEAIASTGRGLPWIAVDENEPFEIPSGR